MNIGRFFKNLYSLFKVDLQKDHKKNANFRFFGLSQRNS